MCKGIWYFGIVRVSDEDKCLVALLTRGAIRRFVFRLTSNNGQLTWDELRVALKEYYRDVTNPDAPIV